MSSVFSQGCLLTSWFATMILLLPAGLFSPRLGCETRVSTLQRVLEVLRYACKTVIFMSGDVFEKMLSRAAQGIIIDLYTNIPAIVRKHPDVFLAGEAGCRIFLRNGPVEVEKMVRRMVEAAKIRGAMPSASGTIFHGILLRKL